MIDMNVVIAENIRNEMKQQSKPIYDISIATGLSLKELKEKMDGIKSFNTRELREVAGVLGTTTQELAKLSKNYNELDSIGQIHKKCVTEAQHRAVNIADKLSDMILFHKKVKENGLRMGNRI